jgi:DNA-3-methyladenine glycosylase
MLCSGPGKLTQALGVGLESNMVPLVGGHFEIRERSDDWDSEVVGVAPRIGITRAVELEWRFCEVGSRYLSRPIPARS